MQQTITVLIDDNGNSSIDPDGFAGQGCVKVLRDFQGKDRAKVERRKATYYSWTQVAHESCAAAGNGGTLNDGADGLLICADLLAFEPPLSE